VGGHVSRKSRLPGAVTVLLIRRWPPSAYCRPLAYALYTPTATLGVLRPLSYTMYYILFNYCHILYLYIFI
jgi:hypothetical protein